jgi:hypothetical protein
VQRTGICTTTFIRRRGGVADQLGMDDGTVAHLRQLG